MTDTLRTVETVVAPAPDSSPRTLKRSIGVVGGTLLTLSCVTPASTLFVVVPDLFGSLGTATAVTIAIGSLLCIAVAFCYSELGTLIPSAGGEYAMVSTLAGRLAGWLVFVLSLLVVVIVPPVIAMGTADYLAPVVHLDPAMTGAGVMLLATLAGLLDLRANAWITGIFLVLEVVAAGLVAILGFAHGERGAGSLVSMQVAGSGAHADTVTAAMVVSGLAIALFVTQGFSTAVYLSRNSRTRAATSPHGPRHPRHIDGRHPGPGRRDHHGRPRPPGADERRHQQHGRRLVELGRGHLHQPLRRPRDHQRGHRHGHPELPGAVRLGARQGLAGAGEQRPVPARPIRLPLGRHPRRRRTRRPPVLRQPGHAHGSPASP